MSYFDNQLWLSDHGQCTYTKALECVNDSDNQLTFLYNRNNKPFASLFIYHQIGHYGSIKTKSPKGQSLWFFLIEFRQFSSCIDFFDCFPIFI